MTICLVYADIKRIVLVLPQRYPAAYFYLSVGIIIGTDEVDEALDILDSTLASIKV